MQFNIPGLRVPEGDLKYSLPIGVSVLGTPVIDDVTFTKPDGKYKVYNNGTFKEVTYPEIKLQTVTITVTQTKNIVETVVAGRAGTIKEYICEGDYNITLVAKVNELFQVFPLDQMTAIKDLLQVQESVSITSKFLNNIFDITKVVVKSITATPVVGSVNEVDIILDLVSDNEFNPEEYEIKKTAKYDYYKSRS